MKTGRLRPVFIIVSAVFMVFVVSCDNGGIIPPSNGTDGISLMLIGTWINPDYDGTLFQENGNPAKVVCTYVSGNDYTWDFYFFYDDEVPIETITMTLTKKWTDPVGNVFTRWYRDLGDGENAYCLLKIHADNETLEIMGSNVDYPAEIIPEGPGYGIFFLCEGNCYGDETYEWYISAQVKIVIPTSEDSFSFYERCIVSSSEDNQEIYWQISARDLSMPFGISINWKESFITDPGTFQVDGGLLSALNIWIMRADPNEPDWYRYSTVDEGSVTFTQVGYQSGDIIEGSFDQLYMYDWDVETHFEVNKGTFRCQVEQYSN